MVNTNYPSATIETRKPGKNYKNLLIGLLSVALAGTITLLLVDRNKAKETIQHQQTEITTVTDQKSDIQRSFDASLARLDSMSTLTNSLQGKLGESNKEIADAKIEIRRILNNKNATAAELAKARNLIAGLNNKITSMEQQVAQLTGENQTLTQDKIVLTQEKERLKQDLTTTSAAKDSLIQRVEVASTLNANNIAVTAVNVRNNGKEKVTTVAKRVNKLVISFDVNNRIAQAGTTDVFVCVIGPDGRPLSSSSLSSGIFKTREEGDKEFTAKLPVEIETAKKKNVEFSFSPAGNFQQGNYIVRIYQNGFLIGEGTRQLRKGGLFS